MAELKPCPFCGGEAVLSHNYTGNGHSYIECTNCKIHSPWFAREFDSSSDQNAINYWNRRAEDAKRTDL